MTRPEPQTKMVKLDKDPLDAKSVNALLIFLYSGCESQWQ